MLVCGMGAEMPDSATTRVGGPPDVFRATFTIEGDDLSPDDISAWLGCAPDESQRKGDVRKRGIACRRGAWSITAELVKPQSPAELMTLLLDRLPTSQGIWDQISSTYDVSLNVMLITTSGNSDFVLSPTQVTRLSAMGASLWVDVYAGTDD